MAAEMLLPSPAADFYQPLSSPPSLRFFATPAEAAEIHYARPRHAALQPDDK